MDSNLNYRHAQTHSAELHRRAELHRLAATARASERGGKPTRPYRLHTPLDLTIRRAGADDNESLVRLAGLDSKHVPLGTFLIAEVDGEPRAAVAIESGEVLADPFHHTAHIAEMLRLRAARLREVERPDLVRTRGLAAIAQMAAWLIPGHRRRAAAAAARRATS